MTTEKYGFAVRTVKANGIEINVATGGEGPAILLLHGWPHTWEVWKDVMPLLAETHRVVAPDLRGLGASTKAESGYDLHTLADDAADLLKELEIDEAHVVGLDLGVQIAWMTAMRHPETVLRLVVMEGLLGTLPGAEEFLANGPPWWFRFHAVPGLAETVLEHNEADYIDWFLRAGTRNRDGVRPEVREAFLEAYSSRDAMRCGFEHYRAFPRDIAQIDAIAAGEKAVLPVLAVAGGIVGDALGRQLAPITADLKTVTIKECAHIIPLESPSTLAEILLEFFGDDPSLVRHEPVDG
jgi:pimeloyl-ACP methyl ester carboxylesterase